MKAEIKAKDLLKVLKDYLPLNEKWLECEINKCGESKTKLDELVFYKSRKYSLLQTKITFVEGVCLISPKTLVCIDQELTDRLVQLEQFK